jgi:predicted RNA-binding protein with RPS1 domain
LNSNIYNRFQAFYALQVSKTGLAHNSSMVKIFVRQIKLWTNL